MKIHEKGLKGPTAFSLLAVVLASGLAMAQTMLGPGELDGLVQRIALYPDPLLAQVLAASTYPDQIGEATRWAHQHSFLNGDRLARAITEDRLPWDPSVQALLPLPSVLDMMSRDTNWTAQLGDAFMAQRNDVMDAVQRMRQQAMNYGYLRTNGQTEVVQSGNYIEIRPVNPGYLFVPAYDPGVVFMRPRPGFAVEGAISFGPRIGIGAAFAPWGWGGGARVFWNNRTVYVNNHEWNRTWENRRTYVHPYERVERYQPERRVERHPVERHERDRRR